MTQPGTTRAAGAFSLAAGFIHAVAAGTHVEHKIAALSMGNPHAVQWVKDVGAAPVGDDGPAIEHHPRFARRVNAGFMQIVDRHSIKLRVFERGAGETLADRACRSWVSNGTRCVSKIGAPMSTVI